MCTTDLCNANDYNFHTERVNQLLDLFARPQTSSTSKITIVTPKSTSLQSSAASSNHNEVVEVKPSSNGVGVVVERKSVRVKDGAQERTETLWSDQNIELFVDETKEEVTARSPRQTQGSIYCVCGT